MARFVGGGESKNGKPENLEKAKLRHARAKKWKEKCTSSTAAAS